MLGKKTAVIAGCSGTIIIIAMLLVFGTDSTTESTAPAQKEELPRLLDEGAEETAHQKQPAVQQTEELPRLLGGGFPPPSNLTDHDIGSEVPRFINASTESGVSGQSAVMINPEHSKYDDLLVLDGYDHLQVFIDDKDESKDVILGKIPVTPTTTGWDALFSKQYIWITLDRHLTDNVSNNLYLGMPLNTGYKLIEINDEHINAPFKGMDQIVDWDGNDVVVRPSDLWFVTPDWSYTIRGHILQEESVKLANIILSIEEE